MNESKILSQKGQMSIFLATSMLALITFIAFIINIGMFVKSKINLQNAVDAAAWSGAAVQARQLTNIAYMNWEMRNTYKEWMFKYYVLGNLSLDKVSSPSGNNMDFRMNTLDPQFGNDNYNFPSVCINFSNTGNEDICKNYSAPGLPVFETSGLLNVDEATTALVNGLASAKAEDCSERASINFLTANLWAYNVRESDSSILNEAPEIATNRQGAFPQAFELALRIRNLERFVNKAPFTQGVCINPSASPDGKCGASINDIVGSQGTSVSNERIVKAFFAGFRNIGNDHDRAMKDSFTLTEIPPVPVVNDQVFSLSNILIPSGSGNFTKHYLDLKLMTMNYATFYTSFNPSDSTINTSVGQVKADGQCDATKVALPVPGYPIGFVKNPRVLTYYAVRGEALFSGLFNPFNIDNGGIKITAFSAAKPFGGRIGPMLMSVFDDETKLFARSANGKNRSSPYLIGLDLTQVLDRTGTAVAADTDYVPGAPLPLNGDPANPFWLTKVSEAVGGFTQNSDLVFSLPNMAYDYPSSDPNDSGSYYAPLKIDVVKPAVSSVDTQSGLYNANIFKKLRNKLVAQGGALSPDVIQNAIDDVRAPTLLDANNYLIPTPNEINKSVEVDSYGHSGGELIGDNLFQMSFFAPLISDIPDSLYQNVDNIESVYNTFIQNQDVAVKKYKKAMNISAIAISKITSSSDGTQIGLAAARNISNINYAAADAEEENPSCDSIAGRFIFFFQGDFTNASQTSPTNSNVACPKPLREIIKTFWTNNLDSLGLIYSTTIKYTDNLKNKLFSGYRPGPLNDASINGIWKRSIGSSLTEKMFRNFYSTKLVQMKSLLKGGSYDATAKNFAIMSEGNNQDNALKDTSISSGQGQAEFQNPLDVQSIGIDLSEIDY